MKEFNEYLNTSGEVGYVTDIFGSICFVEGLPNLHLREVVSFENGAHGMAFSLNDEYAEVLLLTNHPPRANEKVARTSHYVRVGLGDYLLGSIIDPIGNILHAGPKKAAIEKWEKIDKNPLSLLGRSEINTPFYTGVKFVDIIVPLGKGQRELIIGERKTGKTLFVFQTMLHQIRNGSICVFASIGKKQQEIDNLLQYIQENNLQESVVTVISAAADTPGKVYLTPYTAMTIAEYFQQQGKDVVVILDDMTTHAKYYRELSLEAKRFPGRSSYPGDIFYTHARIMERAGNFDKGSITCLPIADTVSGDLSGYIQTNLMSMTDGHIYFDIDRYNQGLRPAVNPFLSVTRVGLQAQSPLVRDISRQVSSFLVKLEGMRELLHFGAEAGEQVTQTIHLGDLLLSILKQDATEIYPINIVLYLIALTWSGFGKELPVDEMSQKYSEYFKKYQSDENFRSEVDKTIAGAPSFNTIIQKLKQ